MGHPVDINTVTAKITINNSQLIRRHTYITISYCFACKTFKETRNPTVNKLSFHLDVDNMFIIFLFIYFAREHNSK